jgi:hypothetical protein
MQEQAKLTSRVGKAAEKSNIEEAKNRNEPDELPKQVRRREGGSMSMLLKLDIAVGAILLVVFYFFITRQPSMWTLRAFGDMIDPRNLLKPR